MTHHSFIVRQLDKFNKIWSDKSQGAAQADCAARTSSMSRGGQGEQGTCAGRQTGWQLLGSLVITPVCHCSPLGWHSRLFAVTVFQAGSRPRRLVGGLGTHRRRLALAAAAAVAAGCQVFVGAPGARRRLEVCHACRGVAVLPRCCCHLFLLLLAAGSLALRLCWLGRLCLLLLGSSRLCSRLSWPLILRACRWIYERGTDSNVEDFGQAGWAAVRAGSMTSCCPRAVAV